MCVVLICLLFFSCKSNQKFFLIQSEKSLKQYILENRNNDKKDNQRYIKNEIKFLIESRNDFFSKYKFNSLEEINLIEIFNPFSKKNYIGVIKKKSKVYCYENGFEIDSKYREIDFDEFKKEYQSLACMLIEVDNNSNKLLEPKRDNSFHFTVYITKYENKKITTYKTKNICFLDKNNKANYGNVLK
jgi:hypothetical protein